MEENQPIKKPSKITIVNTVLVLGFALLNLILAYKSFGEPMDSSEFGAMRNFALSLALFLIVSLTLISIFSSLFMLKLKRWALFVTFICISLIIPFLAFSDFKEIVFELSPGAPVSLNHEILPAIILILLLFSWKDFRKKA